MQKAKPLFFKSMQSLLPAFVLLLAGAQVQADSVSFSFGAHSGAYGGSIGFHHHDPRPAQTIVVVPAYTYVQAAPVGTWVYVPQAVVPAAGGGTLSVGTQIPVPVVTPAPTYTNEGFACTVRGGSRLYRGVGFNLSEAVNQARTNCRVNGEHTLCDGEINCAPSPI